MVAVLEGARALKLYGWYVCRVPSGTAELVSRLVYTPMMGLLYTFIEDADTESIA